MPIYAEDEPRENYIDMVQAYCDGVTAMTPLGTPALSVYVGLKIFYTNVNTWHSEKMELPSWLKKYKVKEDNTRLRFYNNAIDMMPHMRWSYRLMSKIMRKQFYDYCVDAGIKMDEFYNFK